MEPSALKLANSENENNSFNTIALYNSTNNYINHLNLQSINNFQLRLSALPEKEKRAFIKQFRFNRHNTTQNESKYHNNHTVSNIDTSISTPVSTALAILTNGPHNSATSYQQDIDDEITSLHNKNQSSLKIFRKQYEFNSNTSTESQSFITTIITKKKLNKNDNNNSTCDLNSSFYEQKKKNFKRVFSYQQMNTSISEQHNSRSIESPQQGNLCRSFSETPMQQQHYVFTGWDDYFERFHKISTNQAQILRTRNNAEQNNNSDLQTVTNISENNSNGETVLSTNTTVNYGKSERLKFKVAFFFLN